MIIRAGRFNRRVTLLRFGVVENEYGDDIPGYTPFSTVPASKSPAPGKERVQSGETAAAAPVIFWIRWSPSLNPDAPGGLTPKDRLQYPPATGRFYDIVSVIEIGRRDGIEIAAVARSD